MERGRLRRWVGRHRRRILIALGALVLVVRVALPSVLRRVIESQANAAIAGRVTVGDVDLYLLRGAVALDDVALRFENAPPENPPVVAFKRFYVNVGYLPFLFHTVRIQDVELDGLAADVDREADGTFVLPALRPPPPDAPPPPEEPAGKEPARPWSIVVDRAAIREGTLTLDDRIVTPPVTVSLGLPAMDLVGFNLQYGPDVRPSHGVIEARFGDGRMRIKTSMATMQDGFSYGARLDVHNVPLDKMHVHVPQLRWTDFRGRLDAGLTFAAHPHATPVVNGRIALRDLQVDVPDESEPGLAWKRLDVEIARLDREQRFVHVKRVALEHAGVIVQPREPVPLPILPRPDGRAPSPPPDTTPPAEPWRWKVDALEIRDSMAKVTLAPPPLSIGIVRLTATGLSSERESTADIALELREGDGTVTLDGTLGLDPLAARQKLRVNGLDVERLVVATGATPASVGAKIDAALDIGAEHDPVTVTGTVGVHELAIATKDNEDFAFGWRDFDVAIRELVLPGVLPGAVRGEAPIRLVLDHLTLNAPTATLTRTAEGFVLPVGGPAAGAEAPAPTAPEAAPPPTPSPAGEAPPAASPVTAEIAQLEMTGGLISFADRVVQPPYRGKVSSLELRAKNVHYPENTFDTINLSLRAPGGAPITVDGVREKGAVRIQSRVDGLPLAQFNPYVKSAAGYSISRGSATFGSTVRWTEKSYQSDNRLTLQKFALAGAEGDSLFMQNFGIPLTLALGLLTDMSGKISLGVPVKGDRQRGASIDLGAIVGEALAHAIINAVASPLKLIGAVTMSGDKVGAIAPDPVGFIPGLAEVADDDWWRVEQLANFMPAVPTLKISLAGMAGPADARALSEAAVLAEMKGGNRALGALRNVASGGARGAIRAALEKRVRGAPGELEPDEMKELDRMVAEKPVTDDQLRTLATARAERLRKLLADDYSIGADRVTAGDAVIDREGGKPQVVINLGS